MTRSKRRRGTTLQSFSNEGFVEAAISARPSLRVVAALEVDGDFLILHPEGAAPNKAYRIHSRDVEIVSESFVQVKPKQTFYNIKIRSDSACTLFEVGKSAEFLQEFSAATIDLLPAATTLQASIALGQKGEGTLRYGSTSVPCLGKPGQPYPKDQMIENIEGVQYEGDYGSAYKFKKWVSSQFNDPQGNPAVMLWSAKIDGLHGIFIHEDPDTIDSNGGQPSQGCIHLANPNAKNFYDWITARTRIQISYPW